MLKGHPDFQSEQLAIFAVKDACVESVLMSVRDLDDFFLLRADKKRRSHESDIRAVDFFGYISRGAFLSNDERDSINQWIAHLTYNPVQTGITGKTPVVS